MRSSLEKLKVAIVESINKGKNHLMVFQDLLKVEVICICSLIYHKFKVYGNDSK
jgi:hypothetical protein